MKLFKDDAKFVAQDRLRLRNSLRESVSSLHHICMCSLVRRVNLCVRSLDCYEFRHLQHSQVIAMIALARKYRKMCESRFKNEITR